MAGRGKGKEEKRKGTEKAKKNWRENFKQGLEKVKNRKDKEVIWQGRGNERRRMERF